MIGVARLEGHQDRRVLVDVLILPLLRPAPLSEEPPADVGDPETLEQLRKCFVARRARDREMERPARIVHLIGGRSRRPPR